jgi:hypothetical protein
MALLFAQDFFDLLENKCAGRSQRRSSGIHRMLGLSENALSTASILLNMNRPVGCSCVLSQTSDIEAKKEAEVEKWAIEGNPNPNSNPSPSQEVQS